MANDFISLRNVTSQWKYMHVHPRNIEKTFQKQDTKKIYKIYDVTKYKQ